MRLLFWILGTAYITVYTSVVQCSPDTKSSLQAAALGDDTLLLRLHGPMSTKTDALSALDSIVALGESNRKLDERDFLRDQQRIILVMVNLIRDVVSEAFVPLLEVIPPPPDTVVAQELEPLLAQRTPFQTPTAAVQL